MLDDALVDSAVTPEIVETVETVGTSDEVLNQLTVIHDDLIACRDLLTILVALLLAYTASKIILGWFHGL